MVYNAICLLKYSEIPLSKEPSWRWFQTFHKDDMFFQPIKRSVIIYERIKTNYIKEVRYEFGI